MKKIIPLFLSIILAGGLCVQAQVKDPMPVKKLGEKGAKADIIISRQYKMKQLNDSPQILKKKDSVDVRKIEPAPMKKHKDRKSKSINN